MKDQTQLVFNRLLLSKYCDELSKLKTWPKALMMIVAIHVSMVNSVANLCHFACGTTQNIKQTIGNWFDVDSAEWESHLVPFYKFTLAETLQK